MGTEKLSWQYMCTYCGKKVVKHKALGRPEPGTCPRRVNKNQPHRWVRNKEM